MEFGREEIERRGLDNIELQTSNLIVDLDRLFEQGRVARFHINFPDPWFKARQHNRRWLSDEAVAHLVAALQEGGEIFFQSDVWDLALEALRCSRPRRRSTTGGGVDLPAREHLRGALIPRDRLRSGSARDLAHALRPATLTTAPRHRSRRAAPGRIQRTPGRAEFNAPLAGPLRLTPQRSPPGWMGARQR